MRILSPTFIGKIAHYVTQLLYKTLRVSIYSHPEVDPNRQYVYGFWHGKQFAPLMLMPKRGNQKQVALVSASRDGDMLATWLNLVGYHTIRGSSSRKGISSLVKLIAATKEGYSVGIAADGPRGPEFAAKAGISFLAYKAGLGVIPFGAAYSHKWQFNSWDKYQLPRPFAKVVLYLGQPMAIENLDNVEEVSKTVSQVITEADKQALQILQGKETALKIV